MPNISLIVPAVEQSVLRPIIIDIVNQLKNITKIPSDSLILFPGDIEKTYQPGSTIDKPTEDRSRFLTNNMVHIEVDEDYNHDAVLSTAVTRPEHIPIFIDQKLNTIIRPVYSPMTVSISFKFRSKSKSTIKRWRDDIRMRTSMMRDVNLHQISYHYLLPDDIIRILKEIHRLREATAPYGEDFATYLSTNSTTRLTELSNQSGEKTGLGIAETQMRIVGYFDFDGYPDKFEQDTDSETYIGTFSYKFGFDKPIACNMKYPIMIHNQILSTEFRPPEEAYNLDNQIASYSESFDAFSYFEVTNKLEMATGKSPGVTLPPFDEFNPTSTITSTAPIFTALCQISDTDKRTLINLRELDFIELDPDILQFITEIEYPFLIKPFMSIFNISLYKENNISAFPIALTPALDVIATQDLDFRLNYRIRMAIVTDLSLVAPEAIARLRKYPKALVKILMSIIEALRSDFGFTNLALNTVITQSMLQPYINKGYTGKPPLYDGTNNYSFKWWPNLDNADTRAFFKWWDGILHDGMLAIVNRTNGEIDRKIRFNTVQLTNIVAIRNSQLRN